MKRSERLALELEQADVEHSRTVSMLRMLALLCVEGAPTAREMARDILLADGAGPRVSAIRCAGGTIEIDGHGWPVALIGWTLGELLRKEGGGHWNNIETTFSPPPELPGPRTVVTVQRVGGKTPNEQKRAALSALRGLYATLARCVVNDCDEAATRWDYHFDAGYCDAHAAEHDARPGERPDALTRPLEDRDVIMAARRVLGDG